MSAAPVSNFGSPGASVEEALRAEVLSLRRTVRRAVTTVAHASRDNPMYEDAYQELDAACRSIAAAEASEKAHEGSVPVAVAACDTSKQSLAVRLDELAREHGEVKTDTRGHVEYEFNPEDLAYFGKALLETQFYKGRHISQPYNDARLEIGGEEIVFPNKDIADFIMALQTQAGLADEFAPELDHGETVLRIQGMLGFSTSGWAAPDVVIDHLRRAIARKSTHG